MRVLGLVFLFIQKMNNCKKSRCFGFLKKRQFIHDAAACNNGQYIVSPFNGSSLTYITNQIAVIHLSEDILSAAKGYLFYKAAEEVKHVKWAYGVVVSMFDFHRSDRGSNPGRGGKIS